MNLKWQVISFSMETWRRIVKLQMEEPQSILTECFMLALSEFEQVITHLNLIKDWNICVKVHCFKTILLFLVNGYSGKLIVSDNQSRVLYNDNFPLSSPTIFFTNSSLTNWLHMNFNSSLDIAEIEVFGGMYEHYVPAL